MPKQTSIFTATDELAQVVGEDLKKGRSRHQVRQNGMAYIEARSIPEPNTGCWLWLGAVNHHGYGQVNKMDISISTSAHRYAHRYAYESVHGKVPDGLGVLHKCDQPSCVNPRHLFPGDQKENMRDARSKNRPIYRFGAGEQHNKAKLSEADVRYIRENYVPKHPTLGRNALANRFGVSPAAIGDAFHRTHWRNVQ